MIKNIIKENRKTSYDEYKTLKKKFFKSVSVPLKLFYLNKRGYNYNLIQTFIKKKINIKKNISVLDICNNLDKTIPHYCYHFNLSIAGNCRMCLVELYKSVKPIVSCAVEIAPGQKISTDTLLVKRARQGIMEFLLVNHPLDCPICDQGGECDLQDQSLTYGSDRGRFYHSKDKKRSVTELICNHFVNLILTRCIHCTRCVRFLNEVAGEYSFGLLGRGRESEIGLYKNTLLSSELVSNIADFCPVGALTIKYYALKGRPWEEDYIESIDLSDSLCVPIRVYTSGLNIKRILPEYNTDLNLSWITEKTRFLWDSLLVQQLDYPTIKILSNFKLVNSLFIEEDNFYNYFYYKNKEGFFSEHLDIINTHKLENNFMAVSWKSIGYILLNKMKNSFNLKFSYYVGDFLDLETLLHIKESALYYGSNNISTLNNNNQNEIINQDFDSNYIVNITNFDKYKSIILLNLNLRLESPILNAKLRQKYLWDRKINIFYLGEKYNLTYKYKQIGITTKVLLSLIEGKHFLFNFLKNNNSNSLILFGNDLQKTYKSSFNKVLFAYLKNLNKLIDIQFLSRNASSLGCLDLSLSRSIIQKKNNNIFEKDLESKNNLYYYINCNVIQQNITMLNRKYLAHKTFVYQNSHGDNFFWFMDFFLPTYSYAEKDLGYYTNTFGILRKTRQILLPRNDFIQTNIDLIKLIHKMVYDINFKSKSYNNEKGSLRLYSYIPIHLFVKRRFKTYNILEKRTNFSFVFFYKYSSKNRNFYKNNILATFSANLNMISYLHFSKKSNLVL